MLQQGALFGFGHVRIVDEYGVVGLPQRTFGAVCVAVVALFHVGQHGIVGFGLSFGLQFVVAALGAYFGRGGNKHFQLGVGKNHGADVATIHHDAFVDAHALLLAHKFAAHKPDGAHAAGAIGHFERAYQAFDIFSVQIGLLFAGGVGLKTDLYVVHGLLQPRFVDGVVGDDAVAQAKQRHCPIHGSSIDIHITHIFGQLFSHGAFAARRIPVDGYDDFFHDAVFLFLFHTEFRHVHTHCGVVR